MAKLLAILLILIGVTGPVRAQSDSLLAFVDRNEVSVNDIITLTIRIGALLGDDPPSLDGLNQDFDRLGTTISSSYTSINGQVEEWTEYRVTLRPKTTGRLVIPALRKGNASTQPIVINVGEALDMTGASSDEIFLRTSLNKESVYVQEQLVYTIKLYYSIRFDQGAQLSNPQVENAVIQQLGADQNYQEIVEGIRYDVTERKFVIFPQNSGELVIPPVYFTATIGGRSGISRLLSRNTPARQVNLASDAYTIEVKGIPQSFDGITWLPASELTLEEDWSEDVDSLEVGESVTRNLTLRATGLSSSLLPAMEYEAVDGLRFYPDQPTRRDTADNSGVIGVRSEGTAIVPAEPGDYSLPEMSIPWWNVTEDRMEYASIPARTLAVSGGQPAGVMPAPQLQQAAPGVGEFPPGGSSGPDLNPAWIAATVAFGLAWLFSTFMWMRSRQAARDLQVMAAATAFQPKSLKDDEFSKLPRPENALRYLQQACEKHDMPNIRRWAVSWGQAFFRNRSIKTLDQLQAACRSEIVTREVNALERSLYGLDAGDSAHDPRLLLKEIISINKKGPAVESGSSPQDLPPLYKN